MALSIKDGSITWTGGNNGWHGPKFFTGEPLRDYNFVFYLCDPLTWNDVKSGVWTVVKKMLFSEAVRVYVSLLAEKVTLPDDAFELSQAELGSLQIPYPKGFKISNLTVQYLEDEFSTVWRWHHQWMNGIRGASLLAFGGMTFEPLRLAGIEAYYFPVKRVSLDVVKMSAGRGEGFSWLQNSYLPAVELPMGGERFPCIFPVSISRSPGDKAGSGIAKTTVTYARIPTVYGRLFHKYPERPGGVHY